MPVPGTQTSPARSPHANAAAGMEPDVWDVMECWRRQGPGLGPRGLPGPPARFLTSLQKSNNQEESQISSLERGSGEEREGRGRPRVGEQARAGGALSWRPYPRRDGVHGRELSVGKLHLNFKTLSTCECAVAARRAGGRARAHSGDQLPCPARWARALKGGPCPTLPTGLVSPVTCAPPRSAALALRRDQTSPMAAGAAQTGHSLPLPPQPQLLRDLSLQLPFQGYHGNTKQEAEDRAWGLLTLTGWRE